MVAHGLAFGWDLALPCINSIPIGIWSQSFNNFDLPKNFFPKPILKNNDCFTFVLLILAKVCLKKTKFSLTAHNWRTSIWNNYNFSKIRHFHQYKYFLKIKNVHICTPVLLQSNKCMLMHIFFKKIFIIIPYNQPEPQKNFKYPLNIVTRCCFGYFPQKKNVHKNLFFPVSHYPNIVLTLSPQKGTKLDSDAFLDGLLHLNDQICLAWPLN